jgi:MOSC domain-containing protein YiiM
MPDLRDLVRRFPDAGVLEAVFLRPARDVPACRVDEAVAVAGRGLVGDRSGDRAVRPGSDGAGGSRQVTLLQSEHVPVIAAWTHRASLDAAILRRNLVVAGVNLAAARSPFRDQAFSLRIGADVVVAITGACTPCSKMEDALGPGGYNALRGHGGMTARVLVGGIVRVGDRVIVETADADGDTER